MKELTIKINKTTLFILAALIIGIGLGYGGSTFLGGETQANPTNTNPTVVNNPTPQQPAPNVTLTKSDHKTGAKNPKSTLVVYTDFECSYCQKHHSTINQLLENYGTKIAVVYRHFPLSFHQNAGKAAEAAECAGAQNKFFEYADVLFKNSASLSPTKFKEFAKNLGLNTSKFDSCMSSGDYVSKVSADMQSGADNGVQGTPGTVLIDKSGNQRLIEGAYPYEQMEAYIKSAI